MTRPIIRWSLAIALAWSLAPHRARAQGPTIDAGPPGSPGAQSPRMGPAPGSGGGLARQFTGERLADSGGPRRHCGCSRPDLALHTCLPRCGRRDNGNSRPPAETAQRAADLWHARAPCRRGRRASQATERRPRAAPGRGGRGGSARRTDPRHGDRAAGQPQPGPPLQVHGDPPGSGRRPQRRASRQPDLLRRRPAHSLWAVQPLPARGADTIRREHFLSARRLAEAAGAAPRWLPLPSECSRPSTRTPCGWRSTAFTGLCRRPGGAADGDLCPQEPRDAGPHLEGHRHQVQAG